MHLGVTTLAANPVEVQVTWKSVALERLAANACNHAYISKHVVKPNVGCRVVDF